MVKPQANSPNPVDVYVGGRVRVRRKFLGMSQSELAQALGLTFQQVQKYERGGNRISASKLFQTATMLNVPVSYFFDGLIENDAVDGFAEPPGERFVHGFLMTAEGVELAQLFPRIANAKIRKKLLELARLLTGDE